MKLSTLLAKEATTILRDGEDEIEITYRVNVITPAFLSGSLGIVEQVRATVVRWGITDDSGQELSVDAVIEKLSYRFLDDVMAAVVRDLRLSGVEKKSSSDG